MLLLARYQQNSEDKVYSQVPVSQSYSSDELWHTWRTRADFMHARINESKCFAKATAGLSRVLRLHCGQLSLVPSGNLQGLYTPEQNTFHVS
jgi:hypothetical protein